MTHLAIVALGSNQGTREANMRGALEALDTLAGTQRHRTASLYQTEPINCREPHLYLNSAASYTTDLDRDTFFEAMMAIEARFGRERPYPNAPRTLDLDLLLWDDDVVRTPRLTVPHPRLHERLFVLAPLLELVPADRLHPHLGRPLGVYFSQAEACETEDSVRLIRPPIWATVNTNGANPPIPDQAEVPRDL